MTKISKPEYPISSPEIAIRAATIAFIHAASLSPVQKRFIHMRDIARIRASAIACTNWCDFSARGKMLSSDRKDDESEETDATATGTIMHKILEESQGRRFTHEQEFMSKIAAYNDPKYGFKRKFQGIDIYCDITGHPDDFQILPSKRVAMIEYKTTKIRRDSKGVPDLGFLERFKLCMARFQIQVYCWILEPTLLDLGYFLDDLHQVSYYDSETFSHLKDYLIEYRVRNVEVDLARAVGIIKHPEFCISPKRFKCNMCRPNDKAVCPIWQSENRT